MRTAAQPASAFPLVFEALKQILKPYEKNLKIMEDTPVRYTLGGAIQMGKRTRESMLMAVYSMKNYVSIHLMPLYISPESGDEISAELQKRRQGKACFNFAEVDPKLFKEIEALVKKCITACKAKKLI